MPTPFEAISGVANACQALPSVVTGGQPAAKHLEALKASGVSVVLDLRDPMEPRPYDEPAFARQLGLDYVNVVVNAGTLNDETLESILAVLRQHAGQQIFVHCASANRVGGAMIPFLMIDHGLEEEDAVTQAMRIGLRAADIMEWGLDYARRHT